MNPTNERLALPPPLLVCNWKAYLTPAESSALAAEAVGLARTHATPVWVAPSTLALPLVLSQARSSLLRVGAQNCFWEERGAFTGETSPRDLLELGCTFTLCGHSERRQLFSESTQSAVKRTHAALRCGLEVIYCVGEREEDRHRGATLATIGEQLRPLFPLSVARLDQLLIAYEPVWAVGTGRTPEAEEIQEVHHFIQSLLREHSTVRARVLYGGSVTAANASRLRNIPGVDGFLVGGASTKSNTLTELLSALG